MGSLKNMIAFLEDTAETLVSITEKLEKIQSHFNKNFNNVAKIRSDEIEFLQEEFFKDKNLFPDEVNKLFNEGLKSQADIFADRLKELKSKIMMK